jgi:hypothetical protein
MDGGPFKLPTKENADAARKKKVRRVPDASTIRVIERPTNAFPYRQPTAISPRHPTHLTAQEAIATVKKWVESHIPTKHIKDRTCVVDVSEVRAPIPSFTRTAVRAPSTASDRSSSRTRPRTNTPPFAIEPHTRHPLTHTPTPHTPPPTHAQIVCGDPECAPIDTAVRIIYEGKDDGAVGTAFAFPCTAVELTKEALDERMPPAETYEDWYEGKPTHWPPPPEDVVLRFAVGTRVECKVGTKQWAVGGVTKHWFRQGDWPPGVFAPYQVQLDDGRLIFAPDDANRCIRGEGAGKRWFGCLGG